MLTTTLIPDTAEVEKNLSALQKFLDSISLTKLLTAVVLLAVCLVVTKLFLKAQDKLLGRSKIDKSLHGITRSFTKILLLFITVMVMAGSLGIDVSSLLAVLGVAGLAVSLALQDSLANLASGINILLTKPFVVGDFVTAGTYSGTVEEIRIAYTKLNTPENQVVMIPNRTVTASVITNYSTEGKRRLVVYNKTDIGADASLDPPADIRVSAKTGENIAALRQKMLEMSMEGYAADAQFLIEERHYAALQRALEEVRTAHALCGRVPLDLLGVHLKAAWEALGEITGETANERIIDEIFSKFCVGK